MRRSATRIGVLAMVVGALALAGCTTMAPSPPPPTPVLWKATVPKGSFYPTVGLYLAGLSGGGVAYASDQTFNEDPSQVGSLILGFDAEGNKTWTYHVDGTVTSLDTIRDGRLVVGVTPIRPRGWNCPFDRETMDPVPYLMVLRADGTPDPSFGIGGRAAVALPEGVISCISDGNAGQNQFPSRAVTAVAQSPEGDLVVAGGTFESDLFCLHGGSTVDNYLMRLGSQGSPGATGGHGQPLLVSHGNFWNCNGEGIEGTKLAVLDDGSVLAATRGEPRLVKTLPNGSGLDTTFGDGGSLHDITHLGVDCTEGYHGPATLLSAEPDGSILVGFSDQVAYRSPPPFIPCLDGVARLTASGSVDVGFAGDGLYDTHGPDDSIPRPLYSATRTET